MSPRLDLIIFGATGFTGKYTVEELIRINKSDSKLSWGVAGRSKPKLEALLNEMQTKTGVDLSKIKVFIADVSDEDSLKEMSKNAKVVVNCCGPYRFYGEAVVKACIETQTSHVDVSGEPAYMERMQLEYNEAAQRAGVYIISACGFDSIPADMGVIYLQQQFKGEINSVETYIQSHVPSEYRQFGKAVIHYGTWESLVYGIAEMGELGPLRRKLYPVRVEPMLPRLEPRGVIHKSKIDNAWYLPFLGSDRSVVMRSQRFLYDTEKKRPAQMHAYIGFPSLLPLLAVLFVAICIGIFAKFSCGRKLLLKYPRLFSFGTVSHEGPTEKLMANTKFWVTLYGEGWAEGEKDVDGKKPTKSIKVKVSGTNPGYGATCTALLYAGITVLKESDKMPGTGGVMAPGAAFSKTSLIDNLNKNNLTFEVLSVDDIPSE